MTIQHQVVHLIIVQVVIDELADDILGIDDQDDDAIIIILDEIKHIEVIVVVDSFLFFYLI